MSGQHRDAPLEFVATCDLGGQLRGRARHHSDSREPDHVGWVPANLAIDGFGHLVEPNAFGSLGDLRLRAAGPTLLLPTSEHRPELRVRMADQLDLAGRIWNCCPRGVLTAALEDLKAQAGLTIKASFEQELHLIDAPTHPPFSLRSLRDAEPFGTELIRTLDRSGLAPLTWLAEYGAGQFEVTVAPSDGLRAADTAALVREAIRDLAAGAGRRASLAPMLDPAGIGNGTHIHVSLLDADTSEPVLFDPAGPGGLSEVGLGFASGIIAHAGPILAITAPNPTSYLRLAPHRWSSAGAYLAARDREALIRICATDNADLNQVSAGFNLEFRASDGTANPYLALAALVKAGLHGISTSSRETVWTSALTVDDLLGVSPLPRTLDESLRQLELDETASNWFPDQLLTTYLQVKKSELAQVAGLNDVERCRRMAELY